ncbi:MAG: hypothetical protein VB131_09285 [Burkholderia gladioli]
MTTENSRADALTDEQLDAAVAAWFRASDHEHLVDQDERFRSRMRSAIAIASPADQPAAAPILKSPEGEDPMRFGDRSLESSIKRLTAAYCMQHAIAHPGSNDARLALRYWSPTQRLDSLEFMARVQGRRTRAGGRAGGVRV